MLLRRPKSEKDLRGKLRKKGGSTSVYEQERELDFDITHLRHPPLPPLPPLPHPPPVLALPSHLSEPLLADSSPAHHGQHGPPGPVDFSASSAWTPLPTPTATTPTTSRPPTSALSYAARRAHRRSRSFSALVLDTRSSLATASSASGSSSSHSTQTQTRGAPVDQPWRSREAWLALHAPRHASPAPSSGAGTGLTGYGDRGWRGGGGGGGLFFSHLGSEGRLREREKEKERESARKKSVVEGAVEVDACAATLERTSLRSEDDAPRVSRSQSETEVGTAVPVDNGRRESGETESLGLASRLYRQKTNRVNSAPLTMLDDALDSVPESATLPESPYKASPVSLTSRITTPTPPRRPLPPVPASENDHGSHDHDHVSVYHTPDVSANMSTPPLTSSTEANTSISTESSIRASASLRDSTSTHPLPYDHSLRSSQTSSIVTLESVRPESDTLSPLSRPRALTLERSHLDVGADSDCGLPIIVTPTTTHTFSPPPSGTAWASRGAVWPTGSSDGHGHGHGRDSYGDTRPESECFHPDAPLPAKRFAFGARAPAAAPVSGPAQSYHAHNRLDRSGPASSTSTSSHGVPHERERERERDRLRYSHSRDESLPPLLPPAERWRRPHFVPVPLSPQALTMTAAAPTPPGHPAGRQSLPDYDGAARDLGLGSTQLAMERRAMSDDQHGEGFVYGHGHAHAHSGVAANRASHRPAARPVAWARASQGSENGDGRGAGGGTGTGTVDARASRDLHTARSMRELRGQMAPVRERPSAARI